MGSLAERGEEGPLQVGAEHPGTGDVSGSGERVQKGVVARYVRRDVRGHERGGAGLRQITSYADKGFPVRAEVHDVLAVDLQFDEPGADETLHLSHVSRQVRAKRITDDVQDSALFEDRGGAAQGFRGEDVAKESMGRHARCDPAMVVLAEVQANRLLSRCAGS
jgi:hypothetical protein